jgi:hypothetical protein
MPEEEEIEQEITDSEAEELAELSEDELNKKLEESLKGEPKSEGTAKGEEEDPNKKSEEEDLNKKAEEKKKETPPEEEDDDDKLTPEQLKERLKMIKDAHKKIESEHQDELKKRDEQLAEKEKFIQRQGNELGDLRKKVYAPPTAAETEEIRSKMLEDPYNTIKEINARIKGEEGTTSPDNNSQDVGDREIKENAVNNKMAVTKVYPNASEYFDDICKIVEEDGMPEENIAKFKANPWNEPPVLMLSLIKRVEDRRRATKLEAEITSLKSNKDDILKRIEETANQHKSITDGEGEDNKNNTKERTIADWKDEELDAYLNDNN